MYLKDLFRKKNIVSLKDTTNAREKELIRKISRVGSLRLKLTAKSKFKLSENFGAMPPTITFELVDYPGHVMRARSLDLFGEKKRDDESFGMYFDPLLFIEYFIISFATFLFLSKFFILVIYSELSINWT